MSRENIITAIDLGTDKCVTVIAKLNEHEQLEVLGFSVVPSQGVRRSIIVNLEEALNTVSHSLDAAERMAGLAVKSAVLSISGTYIRYKNSKGVVAVASPDQEITQLDVERVIEAARAISLPADREIVHVIPKDFKVDSQEGIKDPLGMMGVRLEAEAHIITGLSTSLRNFEKCVSDLGLTVDAFVFAALAASEIALTDTEKELGVVLVDIGAGTTSIAAFVEGVLEFSAVIPVGAKHITQDIASGARISMADAEKLKLFLSQEPATKLVPLAGESKADFNKRKREHDLIDAASLGLSHQDPISRKFISNVVMEPRVKEIFSLMMGELDQAGLLEGNQLPAGIVVSGGGALTHNLVDIARHTTKMAVRLVEPAQIIGLTEDVKQANYAVATGLLEYAKHQGNINQSKSSDFTLSQLFNNRFFHWLGTNFKNLFKKIFP